MYIFTIGSLLFIFSVVCTGVFVPLAEKNKAFRILNFTLLAFFASLVSSSRSIFLTSSDDLIRYYEMYLILGDEGRDLIRYIFIKEPAFQLLNLLLYKIFGDISPRVLLFLYVLITNIFIAGTFYRLKVVRFSFVICFLFMLTPQLLIAETQLIRQVMASSIMMLAVVSISNKRRNLLLCLSVLTHYVFVMPVLLYFILKKMNLTNKGIAFSLLCAFIFAKALKLILYSKSHILMFIPLIGRKIEYFIASNSVNNNSLGFSFILVLFSFLIYLWCQKDFKLEVIQKFNILILTNFFLFLAFSFDERISSRFLYLTLPFLPYFILFVMERLKLEKYILLPIFVILVLHFRLASLDHDFSLFGHELVSL